MPSSPPSHRFPRKKSTGIISACTGIPEGEMTAGLFALCARRPTCHLPSTINLNAKTEAVMYKKIHTILEMPVDRRLVLKGLTASLAAGIAAGPLSIAKAAEAVDASGGLIDLTASAAVDHIRNGELHAEKYSEALIAQYHAHENLNTVTYIDTARLLESARAVDKARARGKKLGRLAGLPIMLKDNFNTVGFPTTAGSPFLKGYRPKTNAKLADILFNNGAILFAKANMHELAMGTTSSNQTFGFVKNPYDLSRIPGGSSGGTAVALAARIIPLGFGTDTSGSCRMPAHFCGVAGFRPSNPKTNNPYPVEGIVPNVLDFDVPGPLARNVKDIALVHTAITNAAAIAPASLQGLRIGLPKAYFWESMDPTVAAVMQASLDKLRSAGVVLVDIDLSDIVQASLPVIAILNVEGKRTDLAAFLAKNYPSVTIREALNGIASKTIRSRIQAALDQPAPPEVVRRARATMEDLGLRYRATLAANGVTAILFPTVPLPAPLLPTDGDALPAQIDIDGRIYSSSVILQNAIIGPLYRAPCLSIPAGLTSDGLPVGLELDGVPGGDRNVLGMGMAIETVLGPLPPPTFRA
jgi:Asp-tRNA(Asn)/Glu-tRNA(Gln) amidotransferase A subunit family amidase